MIGGGLIGIIYHKIAFRSPFGERWKPDTIMHSVVMRREMWTHWWWDKTDRITGRLCASIIIIILFLKTNVSSVSHAQVISKNILLHPKVTWLQDMSPPPCPQMGDSLLIRSLRWSRIPTTRLALRPTRLSLDCSHHNNIIEVGRVK